MVMMMLRTLPGIVHLRLIIVACESLAVVEGAWQIGGQFALSLWGGCLLLRILKVGIVVQGLPVIVVVLGVVGAVVVVMVVVHDYRQNMPLNDLRTAEMWCRM